jgi:hypothetical protein
MSEPKKHHYLPQFYLRGFSANGRSIYQIEKRGNKAYLCSVRDAAAIRDYHDLDSPDFKDRQAIEKGIAQAESQLSCTLATVIKSGIVNSEVHANLIRFVSLMRCRVPAFKMFIEESLRHDVRSLTRIMERKNMLPAPPKGLEEVLRADNLLISISNWKCLEFMFRVAAAPKILEMLAAMTPSILKAPDGSFFLTCDQPVAIYHPLATPTDVYGVGIADQLTEISLPLSTQKLLRLSWNSNDTDRRTLTSAEAEEFNRRTIVMADSLAFAPEQSESSVKMVRRYSRCSTSSDFQILEAESETIQVARFRPVMAADRYPTQSHSSSM